MFCKRARTQQVVFLVEIITGRIYTHINFPSDLQNKKWNDFQKKKPQSYEHLLD